MHNFGGFGENRTEKIGTNVNRGGVLSKKCVWVCVCYGTAPMCASGWSCETSSLAHKNTIVLPLRLPRKVPDMK